MNVIDNPIGYNVLMWALSLLGTIITSVLLPIVVKLITAKIKNEKLKYVVEDISNCVITSINYTNQTYVEALKAAGKFDANAQKEAKTQAINYTFEQLTESSKRIISSEGIDLQNMIEKQIEAKIAESKRIK